MASSITTLNPLSTYSAFAPDFRGEGTNSFKTVSLPVTASASAALPKLAADAYPATFVFVPDTARTLKVCGFVTALGPSNIIVHGATTGFSASASTTADHVVLSISDGVISITNAGTNAATAATVFTVDRVN